MVKDNSERSLDWQDNIPFCSGDCPQHDGKRCRELGYRPVAVCIPALKFLISEYEKKIKELDQEIGFITGASSK